MAKKKSEKSEKPAKEKKPKRAAKAAAPPKEENVAEMKNTLTQCYGLRQQIAGIDNELLVQRQKKKDAKTALDNITKAVAGKESEREQLADRLLNVLDGKADGLLPFGPMKLKKKVWTIAELGLTRDQFLEAHYPVADLTFQPGKKDHAAGVNKAIVIGTAGMRYVVIGGETARRFQAIPLMPLSWTPPPAAIKHELTGRLVEFMDAKFLLGTDDDILEVVDDEAPVQHTAGAKGSPDPGEASRGAEAVRLRKELGEELDRCLVKIGLNNADLGNDVIDSYWHLLLVTSIAAEEKPKVQLDGLEIAVRTATINQLKRWIGGVKSLNAPEIRKIIFPPREHTKAWQRAMADLMSRINDAITEAGYLPEGGDDAMVAGMTVLGVATLDPAVASKLESATEEDLLAWNRAVVKMAANPEAMTHVNAAILAAVAKAAEKPPETAQEQPPVEDVQTPAPDAPAAPAAGQEPETGKKRTRKGKGKK